MPYKYYDKTCPTCKKRFKTRQHNRIYCSRPCQFESQKGKSPANKLPIPPKGELEAAIAEGANQSEIAAKFGVSKPVLKKWLDFHGLKTAYSKKVAGKRPTAKQLKDMVHVQFMTYQQIADSYGVDQSLVGLWLDKFNIPRPDNAWVSRHNGSHPLEDVTPEEMKAIYHSGQSLYDIAKKFGVSRQMVRDFFKSNDIRVKHSGWRKPIKAIDGHVVKSSYELRVDNWLHKHGVSHTYEPALPFSGNFKADFLANGWYIEVWGVRDNKLYKERKAKKLELYAANNLPLIEVPYFVFSRGTWISRLEKCLNPPVT